VFILNLFRDFSSYSYVPTALLSLSCDITSHCLFVSVFGKESKRFWRPLLSLDFNSCGGPEKSKPIGIYGSCSGLLRRQLCHPISLLLIRFQRPKQPAENDHSLLIPAALLKNFFFSFVTDSGACWSNMKRALSLVLLEACQSMVRNQDDEKKTPCQSILRSPIIRS
jgi:hypothetical protein